MDDLWGGGPKLPWVLVPIRNIIRLYDLKTNVCISKSFRKKKIVFKGTLLYTHVFYDNNNNSYTNTCLVYV